MIDQVAQGAQVAMTPPEVEQLCGNGPIRLVTCPNGRVMGGFGVVGLAEHVRDTDLTQFIAGINAKRAELTKLAAGPQPANPRESLYTFTKI